MENHSYHHGDLKHELMEAKKNGLKAKDIFKKY